MCSRTRAARLGAGKADPLFTRALVQLKTNDPAVYAARIANDAPVEGAVEVVRANGADKLFRLGWRLSRKPLS